MSDLPNISITHQFNGDTAATGKVNTADLDTQLGNLASNDNLQKTVIDRLTNADNDLASQIVGYTNLKPELIVALSSSAGWQPKASVAVATTANITLSGEQTIDGVLTSASRVLVKNQTTSSENGIYVSAAGAWTRATDADTGAELVYAMTSVTGGGQLASVWVTTNSTAPTVGTDAIVWANVIPAASAAVSTALSVRGVPGNVAANPTDIVAANDAEVLRRSGTTVGFGTVATGGITDAAVTNAKLANVATATFKGRTTAATGVPEDLTVTQATAMLNAFVGDSGSGGTKGLVPAPATGDELKVLKGGGAFGTLPFYASILNSTEIAITAAVTATLNRMHIVSGTSADYTITLPTAVGNAGSVIGLRVKEYASATKQYTLSGTVDGAVNLVLVHTNSVLLLSDGTSWWSISKSLSSPWVDAGAITLTGTTSNPTKGTMTRDKIFWSRSGDTCRIRFEFNQTAAGSAGSGTYLVNLPIGTIDTNKIFQAAVTATAPTVGACMYNPAGNVYNGTVNWYTGGLICLLTSGGALNEFIWSSSGGQLSNATVRMYGAAEVPLSGW